MENKVIDIEVANHTPSPTIDPSVRVILIGHSMGGIVAAETLLSIARDTPIQPATSHTPPPGVGNSTTTASTSAENNTTNLNPPTADPSQRSSSAPPQSRTEPTSNPEDGSSDFISDAPLFPYIQAVLAFDTPYLGIHPGVVAHGAESQYNTASAAYNAYTAAQKFFGNGATPSSSTATPSPSAGALPAPESGGWGKWGRYAMYAGGAAAVAAAGAGVWKNRDNISEGWSWAFSHLEFIGCLARNAELTQRVQAVVKMQESHGVGFIDFYTALGNDKIGQTKYSAQFLGEQRTFCVVPEKEKSKGDAPSPNKKRKLQDDGAKKKGNKGKWVRCTNAKAKNEIAAHVAMFTPVDNPDYFAMGEKARAFVEKWIDGEWYESSGEQAQEQAKGMEEVKEKIEKEVAEENEASKEKAEEEQEMEEDDSTGGAENVPLPSGKDEL